MLCKLHYSNHVVLFFSCISTYIILSSSRLTKTESQIIAENYSVTEAEYSFVSRVTLLVFLQISSLSSPRNFVLSELENSVQIPGILARVVVLYRHMKVMHMSNTAFLQVCKNPDALHWIAEIGFVI